MKIMKHFFLFIDIMKGGVETMVELYAILIINGKRTIDRVPAKLRDDVRAVLEAAGLDENGKTLV